MITRDQVLAQVGAWGDVKPRQVVLKPRSLRFDADTGIVSYRSGKTEYAVLPPAVLQAAKSLRIPEDYAKRCPPTVLLPQLEYWGEQVGDVRLWVNPQHEVVGVSPADGEPIPVDRALKVLEKALPATQYDKAWFDSPTGVLDITAATPRIQEHVVKGDIVQSGVHLAFGVTGMPTPSVEAYILRLACLNGATSTEFTGQFRASSSGDGPGLWDWLKDTILIAAGTLSKEVARLRALREIPLDGNTSAVVESLFAEQRLPRGAREVIAAMVMDRRPQTVYDLYNIITEAGSHRVDRREQVLALAHAAGGFAAHAERCPMCFRTVPKGRHLHTPITDAEIVEAGGS